MTSSYPLQVNYGVNRPIHQTSPSRAPSPAQDCWALCMIKVMLNVSYNTFIYKTDTKTSTCTVSRYLMSSWFIFCRFRVLKAVMEERIFDSNHFLLLKSTVQKFGVSSFFVCVCKKSILLFTNDALHWSKVKKGKKKCITIFPKY